MKIAIAGFGAEGKSALKYWDQKSNTITVFDENTEANIPSCVESVLGENALSKIDDSFDLIIRSPSVNPNKFDSSLSSRVWSSTREFFREVKVPIIGVTGTKGKGTTASLIYEILKTTGKKVHLAGNIGTPVLDIIPDAQADDAVVLELSSFQLWDLTQSPHVAVVLMIEPDHLNVHESFDDYVQAKANIARYQTSTDAIIYHPTNEFSAQIAAVSPARKSHYMTSQAAHVKDGEIVINDQKICSVEQVGLIGEHNLENICAAVSAAWELTQDVPAIATAVKNFKGLPHRLELVAEKNGIKFYDDSYSSAAGATEAAIKSFIQPKVLICGGFDRGLDYTDLAKAITVQANIKKVLLIGETKNKIADALRQVGFSKFEIIQAINFEQIISHARDISSPGDIVLLSPGCASFDMFKNFEDRGNQFKQIVENF